MALRQTPRRQSTEDALWIVPHVARNACRTNLIFCPHRFSSSKTPLIWSVPPATQRLLAPKPSGMNFLSKSNIYARDLPFTLFVLLFGPGLWKSSMQGPLCLTDPSLLQAKPSGKSDEDKPAPRKSPFYKTRADFLSRRGRQRVNK